MLDLTLRHLLQLVAHDEPEFANNHHHKYHRRRDLDQSNLGVQLHQPDSRRPAKGLPCVEHAHRAAAAQNLRLHFAAKGAVEGDDGLVLLGQHRSLHASKANAGREDDEDGHEETGDSDEEVLLHDHLTGFLADLTKVRGVLVESV